MRDVSFLRKKRGRRTEYLLFKNLNFLAGFFARAKRGFLFAFVSAAMSAFLCQPSAKADWLLLLHTDATVKINENWEAKIELEGKFRENMSEYYDLEAMPWVAYRFSKYFKLGLGWRELYGRQDAEIYKKKVSPESDSATYTQLSDHYWQVEHRPLLDFIFSVAPGGWTLEERLRWEYRILETKDPFFRYRNRLKLKPPWKWKIAEIQPWIAWEAYYEDDRTLNSSDRLNRHRFFFGAGGKLTATIKFGGYYYWEKLLKKNEWTTNDEIGFELGLVF